MRALRPRTAILALAVVAVLTLGSAASGSGKPPPPKDKWPPGAVDIKSVSNGCGPTSSVTYKNRQTYARDDGETITVSFRDACDLHDAAYSGAYVWDPINDEFVDFSDPKWTKATINAKFKRDLQRACSFAIPLQPIWLPAIDRCLTEDNTSLVPGMTWGAPSYYDMVTDVLNPIGPRPRIQLDGSWRNSNPGFPACDIGAHPWKMTQTGRKVEASWPHGGDSSKLGRFTGTFVTGDALGDDRVEGPYEITEGGKVVAKGTMIFVVHSDEKFDFTSTGIAGSGTMLLRERTTQSAATKCVKPKPPAKTAPSTPAGTFVLTSSKLKENPWGKEVTVNVAGGTATWDHCCGGGKWMIQYTWKVPKSLTPGKSSSISMSLKTVIVEPRQPLADQMTTIAPDFRQDLATNYPDQPSASKTYTVPLSEGYKDPQFKEIKVYVGIAHATVEYTYHRSGA